MEHNPANPAVIRSIKVGQNVIDYATGREMPADKLVVREMHNLKMDSPKRDALRIAKLKHAGDWNIAPQAIPNLMDALRKPPFSFDVVLTQKDLFPRDPNLIYYPLIYIHGRGSISFPERRPGGPAATPRAGGRDAVRRRGLRQRRVRRQLPAIRRRAGAQQPAGAHPAEGRAVHGEGRIRPLEIAVHQGRGGGKGFPQLEGVKINGHWAIIYSKFDIGCRPGAAHGDRLQGVHLRERPEDRRQYRHLLHPAVTGRHIRMAVRSSRWRLRPSARSAAAKDQVENNFPICSGHSADTETRLRFCRRTEFIPFLSVWNGSRQLVGEAGGPGIRHLWNPSLTQRDGM